MTRVRRRPKQWRPKYGYRNIAGWRQKILEGDEWDYPRAGKAPPFRTILLASARRSWRTLFFARSLGARIVSSTRGRPRRIAIEIPSGISADRLRRFAEHCRRTGLSRTLGIPGWRIDRFAPRRPKLPSRHPDESQDP